MKTVTRALILQGAFLGFQLAYFFSCLVQHRIGGAALAAAMVCINIACVHASIKSLNTMIDLTVKRANLDLLNEINASAKTLRLGEVPNHRADNQSDGVP